MSAGYRQHRTTGHDFRTGRFTGAVACQLCGLIPLDAGDLTIPCEVTDE